MTPELWVNLLVGILGGAVGGTASQLIAGYYKRQGDDRQLAASKEQFDQLQQRWKEEQEFERQKILADDRRELFIKTAHALQRTREVAGGPHVNLGPGWEVWKDEVTKCTDHLFILETELRILAPELAQYVQRAANTARLVRSAPAETSQAQLDRLNLTLMEQAGEAMEQMRKLLGTDTHQGGVIAKIESERSIS